MVKNKKLCKNTDRRNQVWYWIDGNELFTDAYQPKKQNINKLGILGIVYKRNFIPLIYNVIYIGEL